MGCKQTRCVGGVTNPSQQKYESGLNVKENKMFPFGCQQLALPQILKTTYSFYFINFQKLTNVTVTLVLMVAHV